MLRNIVRLFSIRIKKDPISITDGAIKQIKHVCDQANVKSLYFYASGGGCNGFRYNLEPLYDSDNLDKILVNKDGATIHVDKASEFHVLGTTIDYVETDYKNGIIDGGFKFIPLKDYATMCGCGISFNPKNTGQ